MSRCAWRRSSTTSAGRTRTSNRCAARAGGRSRSSSTRGPSTSRSGAAPRAGCSRRAATRRCSSRSTAPRSTSRFVDADAYPPEVAALIRAYLRDQRALQEELAAGLDPAEVARNQRLIAALDALSLALCHGRGATLEGVPGAGGPVTVRVQPGGPDAAARDDRAVPPGTATTAFTLAPWPFAAASLAVGCEARRLGPAGELGDWVPLRFALSPG